MSYVNMLRVNIRGDKKPTFFHSIDKLSFKDGWLKFTSDNEVIEINMEYVVDFDLV